MSPIEVGDGRHFGSGKTSPKPRHARDITTECDEPNSSR